jgi:hypothetical protein
MLTITFVSLVVAAASGFVAWRSIRREHLRADARVASLAAAIDDAPAFGRAAHPDPAVDDSFEFLSEDSFDRPENDTWSDERAPTLTFEATRPHSSVRRRLLTLAIGAAAVVAVVVLIAMTGDRYDPPTQSIVSPHAESLELLSLHATRKGSTLAVTGLVRSRTEEPLTTLTAVVSAIDAKGRPIGRGSVPLTAIFPRGESRFVVTIADVDEAARYRVSFRGATGVLIRHLDRRAGRTSDVS